MNVYTSAWMFPVAGSKVTVEVPSLAFQRVAVSPSQLIAVMKEIYRISKTAEAPVASAEGPVASAEAPVASASGPAESAVPPVITFQIHSPGGKCSTRTWIAKEQYGIWGGLSLEYMSGENTLIMRRAIALEKDRLARYLAGLLRNRNSSLLSIGAGGGSMVSRWNNFSRIVAVEPDPIRAKALRKRLSERRVRRRPWSVLEVRGQDIDAIDKAVESVDAVEFSLSMTFFDPEGDIPVLARLFSKANRYVSIMTCEKSKYLEFMNASPKDAQGRVDTRSHLDGISIAPLDNREKRIRITIPGSALDEQDEYLIDLDGLLSRVRTEMLKHKKSFTVVYNRVPREELLPDGFRRFIRSVRSVILKVHTVP